MKKRTKEEDTREKGDFGQSIATWEVGKILSDLNQAVASYLEGESQTR